MSNEDDKKKNTMKYLPPLVICLMFYLSGCSESSNTATPSPSPSPIHSPISGTPSPELNERKAAITAFLTEHHKGWVLTGISDDATGDLSSLHLTKGKQTKVVVVVIRLFNHPDGSTYWYVYEAKPIDIAQAKNVNLKATAAEAATLIAREETLENLTTEDCEDLMYPDDDGYDGPY